MPAPSLFNLALATAIRFVKDLDDLGAMPYTLARPILMNIHNPEKLHALEIASPHLAKEDAEIWLELIKRDIPDWEKYHLPEETDNWYGVYRDLCDQVQLALDADAEKMKLAIEGISAKRALLTPKIIPESRSARMAGARPSARQRQAAFARRMGGIKAPYDPPRSDSSSKKKSSIFQPTKMSAALSVPTKSLNTRASQIKRAPIALVEEHRRPPPAAKPAAPPPPPKAPTSSNTQQSPARISRRPGMLPPSLQHPMLAQTGLRPHPVSKVTIGAPRTASSAGSSGNASAAKPAAAVTKHAADPKGDAESLPSSSPSATKAAPPTPTAHATSSGPPSSGPAPPRQGVIRRRPAPSIFMPVKRRRV